MFKNLLNELNQLQGTNSVSVPIEADIEGYYDKECPAENCLFGFKIHREDWKTLVRDEEAYCPSCRHAAPAKSWYTRDQIALARKYAIDQLRGRIINSAMHQDARDWNSRQPHNAFLKITMDVRGVSTPMLLPIAAAEPMRLRTTCDFCGCRYSYIGAAFFCPACGANSAQHTFRQTLDAVRATATAGNAIRNSLDADQAEVLIRSLLEKGVQDAVMAFQRLCEQIYARLSSGTTVRRNAFQNLSDGSALWAEATGRSFEEMVPLDDLQKLLLYFQQRHLIAHRQGIVDEDYIVRSGDGRYASGQRLIISQSDVMEFSDLVDKLGTALIDSTKQG